MIHSNGLDGCFINSFKWIGGFLDLLIHLFGKLDECPVHSNRWIGWLFDSFIWVDDFFLCIDLWIKSFFFIFFCHSLNMDSNNPVFQGISHHICLTVYIFFCDSFSSVFKCHSSLMFLWCCRNCVRIECNVNKA